MKLGKILVIFCILCLIQLPLSAQSTQWGKLMISLPAGWGSNMKAGNFIYSNYNITGTEPFSITLFKPEAFSGKPDSLFYEAWKKYLTPLLPTTDIPRPRKWSTDNELPLLTASKELNDKTNPAFYVFGIYVLDGSYQAFLIQTAFARTYREVQAEWQERFLEVAMAGPVKK